MHWRDLIGRHIAKYGTHEPLLTNWIAQYLSKSTRGIFVDVGANLGWHAVHAAQQRSVETVLAFEPDAFNAWLLDRNLSLNGVDNVIVSACAIGAQSGVVTLHRYKTSNRGRHSVVIDHGYDSRTVPMFDLDTALELIGRSGHRVLILKIDVEGYEPAVIAGAGRTLANTEIVVMEYSPDVIQSATAIDRMLNQLSDAGFGPHRLAPGGGLARATIEELRGVGGQLDVIWARSSPRDGD